MCTFRSIVISSKTYILKCETPKFQEHSILVQTEKVITYMPTLNWENEVTKETLTMEILCFWGTCSVRYMKF